MNEITVPDLVLGLFLLVVGINIGRYYEKRRVHKMGKRLFEQAQRSVGVNVADLKGDEKAARIAYLLTRFMHQTITSEENDELDEWVGASDKNMRIFESLTDEENVQAALDYLENIQNDDKNKPQA